MQRRGSWRVACLGLAALCLLASSGCGAMGEAQTAPLPDREICDDGRDNNGDERIDCDDAQCIGDVACEDNLSQNSTEPPFDACATISGDRSHTPVDVIWVVDSSVSMTDEMKTIQQNLNEFVRFLSELSLDVRVVLIGGDEICVPEPLGGRNCTDGEKFRHLDDYVGSHNALKRIVQLYPRYNDFVRDNARRVFVITSDDNSEVSAQWFREQLKNLNDPAFNKGYIVHSIVAYGNHPKGCWSAAAEGLVYLELTDETEGVKFPVCEPDWTHMFNELAISIVGLVELPCSYDVPPMPDNMEFNPDAVQLNSRVGDKWNKLPRRDTRKDCGTKEGWYLNDDKAMLCPASCESQTVGEIEAFFGCYNDIG